ncbi:GntR family transcriptional regulator [Streptomyces kronopolitis]
MTLWRAHEITAALRQRISRGEWRPGHRFTFPTLTKEFRASPETVRYSVRLLRREGLVETRPHLGSRVVVPGESWQPADKDKGTPHAVYVQRVMRERLAEGVYRPGMRIPPLDCLADEFGVSVKTVRDGLAPLRTAGLLEASRHKALGTSVTSRVGDISRRELLTLAVQPPRKRGELYEAFGERKTLWVWAEDPRCRASYSLLKTRFFRYGWALERALVTPKTQR